MIPQSFEVSIQTNKTSKEIQDLNLNKIYDIKFEKVEKKKDRNKLETSEIKIFNFDKKMVESEPQILNQKPELEIEINNLNAQNKMLANSENEQKAKLVSEIEKLSNRLRVILQHRSTQENASFCPNCSSCRKYHPKWN